MNKALNRSPYEANRQKRNLDDLNVYLIEISQQPYNDEQFSTNLLVNFIVKPLKDPKTITLLGFEELDEFLGMEIPDLYDFLVVQLDSYKSRLKRPPAK